MVYLDEENSAAAPRCLVLPASLNLLFQASHTAHPHVELQRKLLRPTSYSCQGLWICVWDFFLSPPPVCRVWTEREGDR